MQLSWLILAAGILVHDAPSGFAYPKECCNGDTNAGDCHPVPCDELVEVQKGIEWHHYTFMGRQIKPTMDQQCHVCATENKYGIHGYCVFVLPSS